jgi:hypothetical protein
MTKGLTQLADLRGVALGMNLRETLDMEFAATMASAAVAESLVKTALEALDGQPKELRQQVFAFADGATARFRVSLPADALQQAMRQAAPLAGLGLPAAAPQPLAPAAPRRNTIIIQGLDEGPKVIPLK